MTELALNGGEPVVKGTLGKRWPIFDQREEKALLEVLRSGAWNRREKVEAVGEAFAAYQDAKYGIPVANGTVALQCALKTAGVEAGDEVIVPALTFVATATSVVLVNAVPIIVDIDPLTYNISPEAVEAAITPRDPSDNPRSQRWIPRRYGQDYGDCRQTWADGHRGLCSCARFAMARQRRWFYRSFRRVQLSDGENAHLWRGWNGAHKR